jgi:hypothetical protein
MIQTVTALFNVALYLLAPRNSIALGPCNVVVFA